jgi:diacylglycerol kinase (ATP)
MPELLVIANGKLQAGSGGRRWVGIVSNLEDVFGSSVEICFTSAAGDATLIARKALLAGVGWIAVAGGDGTNYEVVNGFFDRRTNLRPESLLSFLPCGSGNDWSRTLSLPLKPAQLVKVLAESMIRSVDIGHVRFQDPAGAETERVFLNVAEAGVGAKMVGQLQTASSSKLTRGGYLWHALSAALSYRAHRLEIACQDQASQLTEPLLSVIIANGQYFGAGMRCAPMARPDDGQLEVITIGEFSKFELMCKFRRLIRGSHLSEPRVTQRSVQSLRMQSDQEVLLELDGEFVGKLPARFSVLPRALKIRC